MNSQLQKQILIGGMSGLLILVLIYFFLGGKRDDLTAVEGHQRRPDGGRRQGLRAQGHLRKAQGGGGGKQEKLIEELDPDHAHRSRPGRTARTGSRSWPTPRASNRSPSPCCAQPEGILHRVSGASSASGPATTPWGSSPRWCPATTRSSTSRTCELTRATGNTLYPINATCKVSAFVYNPAKPAPAAKGAAKPAAAAAAKTKDQGD